MMNCEIIEKSIFISNYSLYGRCGIRRCFSPSVHLKSSDLAQNKTTNKPPGCQYSPQKTLSPPPPFSFKWVFGFFGGWLFFVGLFVCFRIPPRLPARPGVNCLKFNNMAKFYCISGTIDLYTIPSRLLKAFQMK